MNNQIQAIKWATDCLMKNGDFLEHSPEIVISSPWSTVLRFKTKTQDIYLKQTPLVPFLSFEPKIIQLLFEQFPDCLPVLLAINDEQHCFMMKDAGQPLRQLLKIEFKPELLCQAIRKYTEILRSTENHINSFLEFGVPDWRLDKLPLFYNKLLKKPDFLTAEGLTENELQVLNNLSSKFTSQCTSLSHYDIPETLGRHDFHDNNILIMPTTSKITFIDLGESAIIHPFFPLYTCIYQTVHHHEIKETDMNCLMLHEACFESWSSVITKSEFIEAWNLVKRIWPIFSVIACYELMMSVDLKSYKLHYANRPSQIARYFREYIEINNTSF